VTWRPEKRNGKTTKRPDQSIADERAWLSFADACASVARGDATGLGYVLGDGVVGIDLDACIDGDTLHEIARDAIEMLDTYAERSPSGRGLHFLIRATIEKSRRIGKRAGVPGREVYDGRKGSARYFTVTGDRLGSVAQLAEGPQAQAALDAFIAKWFCEEPEPEVPGASGQLGDDALLAVMFGAKDGAKWRAMFERGDYSNALYPSQSEADLAICSKLRFYTRGGAAQIDRLFRLSGLMRPKWDENRGSGETYGQRTIATALAKGGPVYMPRDRSGDAAKREAHERKAWAKMPFWWSVRLSRTGGLAHRVAHAIASYADKKGEAFPSLATIAAHCRVSERRVQDALKTLIAAGILTRTVRAGDSNLYRLALWVPETITPYVASREH
jgi:primase-polymerase (primpol)-like protein